MSEAPEVVASLLEAVRQSPRDEAAWRALVGALLDSGQLEAARRALDRARACSLPAGTLAVLDARLDRLRARRLIRSGDDAPALACLDRAAVLDAEDAAVASLRAVALNHLGRFDEAHAANLRSLELAPDDHGVLSNLGANLNDAARFREAEGWLRRALELDASALGARVNLAVSLQGQDRLPEMADELDRLPPRLPDDLRLLVAVGTLHARARRPERALALLDRATTLNPGAGEAWQASGVACQLAGRLDEAVERFRRALGLWLSGTWAPASSRRRAASAAEAVRSADDLSAEPGPVTSPRRAGGASGRAASVFLGRAHRALLDAGRLLDAAGLPFFLVYGTLLGVIREGELLSFDKDVDLGLWWDADRARVRAALTGDGSFRLSGESMLGGEAQLQRQISLRHAATGVCVDIDYFRVEGDHALAGIHHLPVPLECRLTRFGLREVSLLGRSWQVPDPPERFLEDMYGDEWRTPQPLFDSMLSARCITPESVPVALCFGYSRLVMRLRSGDFTRAAAYCRQLLERRADPLLEEALARLAAGEPEAAA